MSNTCFRFCREVFRPDFRVGTYIKRSDNGTPSVHSECQVSDGERTRERCRCPCRCGSIGPLDQEVARGGKLDRYPRMQMPLAHEILRTAQIQPRFLVSGAPKCANNFLAERGGSSRKGEREGGGESAEGTEPRTCEESARDANTTRMLILQ